MLALLLGFLQMCLAILLIGWLWSVFHGFQIYAISVELSKSDDKLLNVNDNYNQRRRLDDAGMASEAGGSPVESSDEERD